jgi:hypothetical protein
MIMKCQDIRQKAACVDGSPVQTSHGRQYTIIIRQNGVVSGLLRELLCVSRSIDSGSCKGHSLVMSCIVMYC